MMLAFGFFNSPGWFGLLAWILAEAHAALGPDEPIINGADSYGGGAPHVDDYFFVAPQLGQHWEMAYEHYRMVAQWGGGPLAINVPKDLIDGLPRELSALWGRSLDLLRLPREGPLAGKLISPDEKVFKLADGLMAGEFENLHLRRVTLKELAEVVGLAVWLSETNVGLKALLPSFYAALSSKDPKYVDPPGTLQAHKQVWFELSDAVVLARQQCQDVRKFTTSFQSSLLRALSPREQISLGVPRAFLQTDATRKDPVVTAGGKAVMGPDGKPRFKAGVFSIACFFLGVYGVDLVARYEEILQCLVGLDREAHIIVGEMLPIVAAAMEHGEEWRGMLITCAVDNAGVVSALNMRASTHPFVRYLALLLLRLAALHGFQIWAYYINTLRNVLADQLTRLDLDEKELQAYVDSLYPGLKRRTYTKLYDFLLAEKYALVRSFALPLDGVEGIETLRANGEARGVWWRAANWTGTGGGEEQTVAVTPTTKAKFVEVYGGAGNGAFAAATAGLECVALVEGHAGGRQLAVARLQTLSQTPIQYASVGEAQEALTAAHEVKLILVAAPPPGPAAAKEIPGLVGCLRPKIVCMELVPARTEDEQETTVREWRLSLEAVVYQLMEAIASSVVAQKGAWESVDVAELGGGQHRVRVVLHFEEKCWAHVPGPLVELPPLPGPPRGLRWALRPFEDLHEADYEKGRFVSTPALNSVSRPLLAGYVFKDGAMHEVNVGNVVELKGREGSNMGEGSDPRDRWTVRFVEPEGLLRLNRVGGTAAEEGQRTVQRSEIGKHVESRRSVWSFDGVGAPVCSSKGGNGPLVLEDRGAEPRVRVLSMGEVWKLQGLSEEDLQLCRQTRRSCVSKGGGTQREHHRKGHCRPDTTRSAFGFGGGEGTSPFGGARTPLAVGSEQ
mmetsp:Transcript_78935/g.157729  ORF Transcript_78935/g.157729 Transcript_78935/m.157729 type:complete len:902 (-) Transcript_78935:1428-4133(-)